MERTCNNQSQQSQVNEYIRTHCDNVNTILCPASFVSPESGQLRNCLMTFPKSEENQDLSVQLFSENWCHGISCLEIDNKAATTLLKKPQGLLRLLRKSIHSYTVDADGELGPYLDCDEDDRDLQQNDWVAGLDSAGACAGLYLYHSVNNAHNSGLARDEPKYMLLVKAGAGRAARQFHARLQLALKETGSLHKALVGPNGIGIQALRRVELGAQRNRTRLLYNMATALGINDQIASTPDHACHAYHSEVRRAVSSIDVQTNFFMQDEQNKQWVYFSGMIDASKPGGIVSCSNVASGVVLFANRDGTFQCQVRNKLLNAVPFGSVRLFSQLKTLVTISDSLSARKPHVDEEWVKTHFTWHLTPEQKEEPDKGIIPPVLWGMHAETETLQSHGNKYDTLYLRAIPCVPKAVVVPGFEPGIFPTIKKSAGFPASLA